MTSKRSLDDLALFGGEPAFANPLHVGCPNIGNRDRLFDRINDLLDRRWFTNDGRYVQAFEQAVQSMIGVRHCIATCNGSLAIDLTAKALGFSGEVIVPSFTFISTAHALYWHGIKPIFCDIDPHTYNIDPEKLASCITPETSGIMGVHIFGRPCAVEKLIEIAAHHSLPLIFDAAHAFGCSYKGTNIGNFGNAEIFSFHATKFVNSFEGGAVVTNDDELAKKIRLMRNFGFEGMDNVISIGINAKMNEVSAAMGLTSLDCSKSFIQKNRENFECYRRTLEGIQGIYLNIYKEPDDFNYQYIVVEIDAAISGINRDVLLDILHAETVLARRYFYPGCHRMEPYRTLQPNVGAKLPETERLVDRVMCLPTGTVISADEINTIADIIRFTFSHAIDIKERLVEIK